MCIIVYKPKGATVPLSTLRRCWESNSDGAGFMFPSESSVWGNKGYMTFQSLLRALYRAGFYDPDKQKIIKEGKIVIHFRLASIGKVCPENCHPFPIDKNLDFIKARYWEAEVGVAHNGTLYSETSIGSEISDTMSFIVSTLASPAVYNNLRDQTILRLLSKTTLGNQFCFMHNDSHVTLLGNWIQDGGVYYSNKGYKVVTKD